MVPKHRPDHSPSGVPRLPQLYPPELPPQALRLLPFKIRLIHPFAHTFDKYVLRSCCMPGLGQVLGLRYSAPGL